MTEQIHYGQGDNIGRDKIINIFSGKSNDYATLVQRIKELEDDLEDIPDSKQEKKERKIKEIEEAKKQLGEFKKDIKNFYTNLHLEDKETFNEIFGNNALNKLDSFFIALNNLKEKEEKLSPEQRNKRRNQFDDWEKYMKSLTEDKLFEQQKRDSLNYLKIFGLTVSSLKEKLNKLGYFHDIIDDSFDKATVVALMKFQEDNEMRHIDGMFGELTFQMLGLKLEELKSKNH